jgi:DNA polymerase III alpha subunit
MFISVYDLVRRRPGELNKRVADALIQGGALDSTGATRKVLFESYEQIVKDETKLTTAREREFVNAVKARVEAAPAGDATQLALVEMAGKRQKLVPEVKLAAETVAKLGWAHHTLPEPETATEAIAEAMRKQAMTAARRQAKEDIASDAASEQGETGIASEDASSGEELTPGKRVEQRAAELIKPQEKARRRQAAELAAQMLIFVEAELDQAADDDGFAAALGEQIDPPLQGEEWEYLDKLNRERAVLGIYVTGHPLDRQEDEWRTYIHQLSGQKGREISEISVDDIGKEVRIVGAVVGRDDKKTKKGSIIFKPTIEDLTGAIEVTVFPKTVEQDASQKDLMEVGTLVCVEARVEEDTFASDQAERAAASEAEGDPDVEEMEEGAVALKLTAIKFYPWKPEAIAAQIKKERPIAAVTEPPQTALQLDRTHQHVAAAVAPVAAAPAPAPTSAPQAATETPGPSAEAPSAVAAAPVVAVIKVTVESDQFNAAWIGNLREICQAHPGEVPVRIVCPDEREVPLKTGHGGDPILVGPNAIFVAAVRALKARPTAAAAA